MYAIALNLIDGHGTLTTLLPLVTSLLFTDRWWDKIGPAYICQRHLIVKANQLSEVQTGTTIGKLHLGSPLGIVCQKQSADLVRRIAKTILTVANTHPHAVYSAFTHGMVGKKTYLAPNIGPLLQPLEDIIRTKLLPALSGKPAPSDSERDLLARLGGIGVTNPTTLSDPAYSASIQAEQNTKQN